MEQKMADIRGVSLNFAPVEFARFESGKSIVIIISAVRADHIEIVLGDSHRREILIILFEAATSEISPPVSHNNSVESPFFAENRGIQVEV